MSFFSNNNDNNNDHDFLSLTLSLPTWFAPTPSFSDANPQLSDFSYSLSSPSITPQSSNVNPYDLVPILSPQTTHTPCPQQTGSGGPIRNNRKRQTPIRLKPGKRETIPPPYEWATDRRAILHDLQTIRSKGINAITGKVKCSQCNQQSVVEYDLLTKFKEVQVFVIENKYDMSQRAPREWSSPRKLDCPHCNRKKCVKPILDKKKSINWLFLLLGQMIGHCNLKQLKYFCKHTSNHKTAAKDRVLYLTYLGLCKQLDPLGDYNP